MGRIMGNEQPAMTTDGRRHPGIFKQVGQLVAASEAAPDLAYMGRQLTLCCLPRTNPGDKSQYLRQNGPYQLGMAAGPGYKLPYGTLPRLVLVWVCSEATQTQSRILTLGDSFLDFMHQIGITDNSGGKRSYRTRLADQMERLFNSSVQMSYRDDHGAGTVGLRVAKRTEFWWDPKRPHDRALWKSRIELSAEFFEEIMQNPVPVDMNILKALTRSSLGLDYYLWINYRVFTLEQPLLLTWPQLYRQFGINPDNAGDKVTVQDFRKKSLRELKKIKIAWPGLDYATPAGGLILRPSPPSIPARQLRLLPR